MGVYVDKRPLYTCAACEAPVRVETKDGAVTCHFDKCEHAGGKVYANVGAALIGKGGFFQRAVRAVKDKVGQGATKVLGRTVVWQ